jgi:CRP-like cAMP-binding protein
MEREQVIDTLAGLSLFGDLGRPQLTAVAHIMSEESFPAGQRILRQGFAGSGFYVILDGEVAVRVDGRDVARLGKGDFFGEISLLLDEAPVADVVALTPIHVLHLAGSTLRDFLMAYPAVMYRMLQSVGRRLARANVQGQVGS